MSDSHYVIGIDIGTTSTKAALFTEKGERIGQHKSEYPLHTPTPDVSEQEPEDVWRAVTTSVKALMETSQIDPARLLCLSFSAAMHSLIAVDTNGKPLTKSITWADKRSAKWATQLKHDPRGRDLYHRTGTPIHAMSPLAKIIWLRNERAQVFDRAAKFISIKEYLFYRCFQQYWVDYSIASATGLMNLKELAWDQEAMDIAGITEQHLSQLVPTTHIIKPMNQDSAEAMGILAETAIVLGASDGVLANLSVGAIFPGIVAVTVGTSGAVRAVVDQPWTDPEERLFCYALTENHWVVGGPVNNGGSVLRWMRDELGNAEVAVAQQLGRDAYELLEELAQTIAPGADGLIFQPYLDGERAPLWDANASGSLIGLTLRHTRAHLLRSVFEGLAFNLKLVLQSLQHCIGQPTSIQVTGGLAQSQLWRQLLADVFNQEVWVSESYGDSCLGAAILGLYALKKISSLEAVAQMVGNTEKYQPDPKHVETYQKILPIYTRLLHCLQGEYAHLAQLHAELTHVNPNVNQ